MKTALITGIIGQDGFLLTRLLESKNYRVIGITSGSNKQRIDFFRKLHPSAFLINGYFASPGLVEEVIQKFSPKDIYNLAAVSSVAKSFAELKLTFQINYHSVVNLLSTIYQNEKIEIFDFTNHQVQKSLATAERIKSLKLLK